jgi:hypothetical protein
MKLAAKISHLIWAGLWSSFLLWFTVARGSGDFGHEPHLLAIPVFSLGWLTFAVALLFDRRWAFYGSFLLAVLSLFVAYYIAWTSVAIAMHERTSFVFEIIGAVAATVVVWLLLQSRHQFLSRHDNAA